METKVIVTIEYPPMNKNDIGSSESFEFGDMSDHDILSLIRRLGKPYKPPPVKDEEPMID